MSKIIKGHAFEGCRYNTSWTLGSTINRDITRTIIVDELTAASYLGRLQEALETPGVPQIGEASPDIVGLICNNLSVEPLSDKQAKITVNYYQPEGAGPEPPTPPGDEGLNWKVEFGCNTVQIQTEQDISNETLIVGFTPLKAAAVGGKIRINPVNGYPIGGVPNLDGVLTKVIPMNVFRPHRTLRAQLITPVARTPEYIWIMQEAYVGRVSEEVMWAGGGERTWLCSSINALIIGLAGGGKFYYDISCEFQHDREGWDGIISYTTKDGLIPPEIASSFPLLRPISAVPKTINGAKRPRMYLSAKFNGLINLDRLPSGP